MSNKASFFSRIKQSGLALPFAKGVSLALNKLAPNWAYRKVEDSFLKPNSKIIDKNSIPHGIGLFKINTRNGILQGYQLGNGPAVLLVHGWSGGAHQFFPLMNGLSRCGFTAITFDHFGHGHSEGQHASLPDFISAVNAALQHINKNTHDGLAAIVGHSMGCIAIANAQPALIKDIPLLLISPVFNFKKYFTRQVNFHSLHSRLSQQYLSKFERSYLTDLDRMELTLKLGNYSGDSVIVHDKEDQQSDILDSINFCSANPLTKLVTTKGYGHSRLINSEIVWQQLKSHLNYEDITANRFN